MVNGRNNLGGGVDRAEAVNEEEVDEISEQVHPELLPKSFDSFLREIHDETATGLAQGMPSLGWIRDNFKTKSAAIRYLHSKSFSVRDISRHLGLRYQHVRNVLTVELKRGPNENWTVAENETRRISPGFQKLSEDKI